MATQPHLLVDDGDLTDIALIPGDPGRVDRIADHCDESETIAQNREYKVVNATYEGRELTICSTGIGCPSAAIAIEELANVGVETFIRVGTTGALQSGIEIGDMIVATGAAKNEGTSKRYEAPEYPAVPDYDVLSALADAAEANDEDVHVGPIASDDATTPRPTRPSTTGRPPACSPSRWRPPPSSRWPAARACAPVRSVPSTGTSSKGQKGTATEDDELPEKAKNNVGRAIDLSLEAATHL